MKSLYKITFFFLLLSGITLGAEDKKKHEKKKNIKKQFTVSNDAKVSLDNKYGDVSITTWNQNKVTIEVDITVEGDDLDEVEGRLNDIDIQFEAGSNFVNAKTFIEKENNSWSFWKKKNNLSFKINYIVKMPVTNDLNVANDYGSISLDNLTGKANINCDYGKVTVGKLSSISNSINLDYCNNSSIGFMKSGDVNLDYSTISIDDSEILKANGDYSNLVVGKTNSIDFNADYGSVKIEEAISIDGNSDYASMRFGTIKKKLNINTEYAGIIVEKLEKGFESVVINSEYAGIKIGVDEDATFTFEMDLEYADLGIDKSNTNFTKKIYPIIAVQR